MASYVIGAVWDLKLCDSAKIVLLCFADHANKHSGSTYPAIETIAKETGKSPRMVQRYVSGFIEQGVLVPAGGTSGGRSRSTRYTIDLEAAGALYGVWKKEETFGPVAHFEFPKKGDTGVTLWLKGKGVARVILSPAGKDDTSDANHDTGDANHDTGVTQTSKEPIEEPSRALDPAVEGGDAHAQSDQPTKPPANAHWKANQEALAARFGDDYRVWLRDLIPLSDDGTWLVLAAKTRFYAKHCQDNFSAQLAELLDRHVQIKHHDFELAAWRKRQSALKHEAAQ